MQLDQLTTDDAVLAELGRRLARQRLERNATQSEIADSCGIGRATLQRLEAGATVQTASLVKVMRALDLLGALDAAVPASVESPIAQLERGQRSQGRRRARGRRSRAAGEPDSGQWRWGDQR